MILGVLLSPSVDTVSAYLRSLHVGCNCLRLRGFPTRMRGSSCSVITATCEPGQKQFNRLSVFNHDYAANATDEMFAQQHVPRSLLLLIWVRKSRGPHEQGNATGVTSSTGQLYVFIPPCTFLYNQSLGLFKMLYPVLGTVQNALHYTPWETCSFLCHFILYGKHSATLQSLRKDYSFKYPPLSVARYHFYS